MNKVKDIKFRKLAYLKIFGTDIMFYKNIIFAVENKKSVIKYQLILIFLIVVNSNSYTQWVFKIAQGYTKFR